MVPFPAGTPTDSRCGFAKAPTLPVAAPSVPAVPAFPGHVSLLVRIADVPLAPLAPVVPTVPPEPPPIGTKPNVGSVKTPPDIAFMSLKRKLGKTGMLGFVDPPP